MEDELLYETTNGTIMSESEAKDAFKDQFDEFVSNGRLKISLKIKEKKEETNKEINFDLNAIYITSDGTKFTGNELIDVYGDEAQSFIDRGSIKKKTRLSIPLGKRQIWLALHQFKKHQIPYWNLEVY
jgi:hypothetical protein